MLWCRITINMSEEEFPCFSRQLNSEWKIFFRLCMVEIFIVFYVPFTGSEANTLISHKNCNFFFYGGHKAHSSETGRSAHNKSKPLNSKFPMWPLSFTCYSANPRWVRLSVLFNICAVAVTIFNSWITALLRPISPKLCVQFSNKTQFVKCKHYQVLLLFLSVNTFTR